VALRGKTGLQRNSRGLVLCRAHTHPMQLRAAARQQLRSETLSGELLHEALCVLELGEAADLDRPALAFRCIAGRGG
jgi:hypothetical protein